MENRNITNRCLEFIQNNKVTHPDQDALNAVLHDSWLRVSNRWNFLSNYHVTYLNMTMCKWIWIKVIHIIQLSVILQVKNLGIADAVVRLSRSF